MTNQIPASLLWAFLQCVQWKGWLSTSHYVLNLKLWHVELKQLHHDFVSGDNDLVLFLFHSKELFCPFIRCRTRQLAHPSCKKIRQTLLHFCWVRRCPKVAEAMVAVGHSMPNDSASKREIIVHTAQTLCLTGDGKALNKLQKYCMGKRSAGTPQQLSPTEAPHSSTPVSSTESKPNIVCELS